MLKQSPPPSSAPPRVVTLTGCNFVPPNAADDVRGRRVIAAGGEDIGEVDEVMVDRRERRVRFLRVSSGGFMGIGTNKFLVPVDVVRKVKDGAVYLDETRERIASSPLYDRDSVDEVYLQQLYNHYGHAPYWSADYEYPPYPWYV